MPNLAPLLSWIKTPPETALVQLFGSCPPGDCHPMRDPKNLTILLLAVLVLVLGGAWIAEHISEWKASERDRLEGEPVSLVDVVLDRRQLSSLDIIFDRALGEGRVGEILIPDPGVIQPDVPGVWQWTAHKCVAFLAHRQIFNRHPIPD